MEIENLGEEEGLENFKKPTKIALIDADTIAYAVCSGGEEKEELLPWDYYSDFERMEIEVDPGYCVEEHCIYSIDISRAIDNAVDMVKEIQEATFTKSVVLFFSSGKNFRHVVDPMYKANRKDTRYPNGLLQVKQGLLEKFPGCICTEVEADDCVVYLKRTQPEKYVLCAIDKDVLQSVPGKHWNYYRSRLHNIEPKWIEVTKEDAEKFPYYQCLMGDSADNIQGCPGIGPKRAQSILSSCNTSNEMWEAVVETYQNKGLTVKDAIRTMRLVNMHQITCHEVKKFDELGITHCKPKIEFWVQPI